MIKDFGITLELELKTRAPSLCHKEVRGSIEGRVNLEN